MVDIKHSRPARLQKERSCPYSAQRSAHSAYSPRAGAGVHPAGAAHRWFHPHLLPGYTVLISIWFSTGGRPRLYPSDGRGGKVMDTDAYAVYFISVCRADPSSRCVILCLPETFCCLIDHTAERGNDIGAVADQQPGAVNTPFLQPVDLPEQDFRSATTPLPITGITLGLMIPRQQMEA